MAHLIPFNKQFSSSAELVTLLRSRGMYIEGVFESWMTVIAVTRNACGHHARVWNKRNAMQPAVPSNPAGRWITLPTDPMRTYFDMCIIKYFLDIISPGNDMLSKMQSLFAEYPEVDLRALGFPSGNWQDEPLWCIFAHLVVAYYSRNLLHNTLKNIVPSFNFILFSLIAWLILLLSLIKKRS